MLYAEHPVIIGHRGSGKTELVGNAKPLENTAASMTTALLDGADGVELDVQRSADNQLVVYHNFRLPDHGVIADHTAAELHQRYGIELLSTISAALPMGTVLNLEVKTGYEQSENHLEHGVIALVADYLNGMRRHRVVVSSFDPQVLRELRETALDGVLALLTAPSDVVDRSDMPLLAAISWAKVLGVAALHAHTEQFSLGDTTALRREIAEVHNAGLALLVWCPAPQPAVALLRAGADAVCVNLVPETVSLFGRANHRTG